MARKRKVPMRTCVGCQTVRPKRELVRIVRTADLRIEVDPTGKKSGRGAYVCPQWDCLERALKKDRLFHALVRGLEEERRRELPWGEEVKQALRASFQPRVETQGEGNDG